MSTHNISWFQDRAGEQVIRNGRPFTIPNKKSARYCLELQEEGFTFSEEAKKPTLRVSVMPESICTACEG